MKCLFDHLETECAREETVSESFPIWSTYRLQTNVSVIFSQTGSDQAGWVGGFHQARHFNLLLLCFPADGCNLCIAKLMKKFGRCVKSSPCAG